MFFGCSELIGSIKLKNVYVFWVEYSGKKIKKTIPIN